MGFVLWAAPAAAIVIIALIRPVKVMHAVSIAMSAILVAAACFVTVQVMNYGTYGYAFLDGLFYIDSVSIIVLDIVLFISFMTAIYSVGYLNEEQRHQKLDKKRVKLYYILMYTFIFTMVLALTVRNMGVMWIAIEATTLASAFLVGFNNDKTALEAAWKYIMICAVGIALALLGIIFLHISSSNVLSEAKSLDWTALFGSAKALQSPILKFAFIFVLIGFGTKAGLAPMHTWLPDAHSQAPSPVSALLSGVLLNSAMYAIIRTVAIVNKNAGDSGFTGTLMIVAGLLSIITAALFILTQKDYKRLLAYSSIEHMGLISLSVGIFTPVSLFAAFFHMINHSLTKSMLFLSSGTVLQKYGTRNIAQVKGILKTLPVTGVVFLLGLFAIGGMPPFGIFASELNILASVFGASMQNTAKPDFWLIIAGIAAVLLLSLVFAGIIYTLFKMFHSGMAVSEEIKPGETNIAGACVLVVLFIAVTALGITMPHSLKVLIENAAAIIKGGAYDMEKRLLTAFKDEIQIKARAFNNEIYFEAVPQKIAEICNFINGELDLPLVSLFANDERELSGSFGIFYVFAGRESGRLFIIRTPVKEENGEFLSICTTVHAAARYEREIKDLFGLLPIGHPDAKRLVFHSNWPEGYFPLRRDFDRFVRPKWAKNDISFMHVKGEGVYEIPVGPVHAGIIEPGHFRFSVAGEPIINLEAQLYYVHKGIEKLCEGETIERCLYFSERISGDETFANSLAYCQAIEKIAGIEAPQRAQYGRVVFAELERLTSHLGDLAGICVDVAYGFAASQFRMMRGLSYLIADELCGMRFLRSVNSLGGLRKDFTAGKEKSVISQLDKIKKELKDTQDIIKANGLFIDRVENTGILTQEIAKDLNAVGPGGRASGIAYDVRKSFPYAAYDKMEFTVPKHNNGDVNCRMNVKLEECFASIDMIIAALEGMPQGTLKTPVPDLEPYKAAFGMTEAPRGENIHFVMAGKNNTIYRYKIRTPSFCNWPALCHAVSGNIVPDFPLINKSFNLSYAGNDL